MIQTNDNSFAPGKQTVLTDVAEIPETRGPFCGLLEESDIQQKDEPGPGNRWFSEAVAKDQDADMESGAAAVDRSQSPGAPWDTSMTPYLREIGRVKLLTRQEEIELAARIKRGDGRARDRMIQANLRLVVKIARAYEGIGVPLPDLVSEGNIGLMRAVERFDPSKGGKMSTYSACWIRQAITRALASQSKAVRLPRQFVDRFGRMRRASLRLQEELGREPTDEELAAELGITTRQMTQMRVASVCPASFEAPVDGEDSRHFVETIPDEKEQTPYEKLEVKGIRLMLQNMIETLNQQEKSILQLRFGFDGEPPKTLEQVGKELELSGERVRQILSAVLVKLRRRITAMEISPACSSIVATQHQLWRVRDKARTVLHKRRCGRPKSRL